MEPQGEHDVGDLMAQTAIALGCDRWMRGHCGGR